MNAERNVMRASWQSVVAIVSAFEACALAAWLSPASVHIVKWSAAGPVRLALLAPAWQGIVWAVAALLSSVAVIGWCVRSDAPGEEGRHESRLGRAGHLAAPFSLLWLWGVPFLPWIPDRLPLLLVLAGPLRWVIAGVPVVRAALAATNANTWTMLAERLNRRAIFALSLAIYLGAGVYSAQSIGVGGDEPHYLIITESLLKDGDLQIENNHRQRDYQSFFAGDLRPDFFERGKNGAIYSIHAPGLPALVLPAYAVGGRLGAVMFIALLAALAALAVFDLAELIGGRAAAVAAWVACCLTVPFIPYAWLIFPEMPGALVVAWAALWLQQSTERSRATWIWRGVALATLPWLHTKFVVFLAIFAAAFAWRLRRQIGRLAACAIPVAVGSALWLYSFYAIYGVFDPEAPYGAYTRIYVLTKYIPHGLLGIFFDQKFGLLIYSPIYLCAIAGVWMMLRNVRTRFLATVLLLAVAAFVGSTARLYMFWGGSSAPARFLVPILPCLAPMVALGIVAARHAVARALIGLWLAISLAVAVLGLGWPARLLLFSVDHGKARILELIQAGSPLSLVVPTFTDPDWASQVGAFAAWAAVALVALVAMMIVGRGQRATTWRAAGMACALFLVGGSLIAAHPAERIREQTAQRGGLDVLQRFDGRRFRTLDYAALRRATPARMTELTTLTLQPPDGPIPQTGYTTGPLALPEGDYEAVVWFSDSRPREGEIIVAESPRAIFARLDGVQQNPARVTFSLPIDARRLTLRVPSLTLAAAIRRVDITPRAVVAPSARNSVPARAIESIPDHPGAYLVYTDEHAYPEGGIFWSRGTAETHVLVASTGARRMTLTLSTGPMSGTVKVIAAGQARVVTMVAGRENAVSFDLPPGVRLVPLTIESSVMFRPAEVDKTSSDMRGLGCQVRIGLE
jgi:hypothetical protein